MGKIIHHLCGKDNTNPVCPKGEGNMEGGRMRETRWIGQPGLRRAEKRQRQPCSISSRLSSRVWVTNCRDPRRDKGRLRFR